MLAAVVLITDAGALVIEDARGAVIAGVICSPNIVMWWFIAISQTYVCWICSTAM